METNDASKQKGTFVRFMLLFVGFIVVLVVVSYLAASFMK